jgi:hypothetical protein
VAKARTDIPAATAANVLFRADRTCCVCRTIGKAVQIHHLDEDPSNHAPANLAVLCFDCHRETQLRGGFGRKLDSNQVALYRDSWNEAVEGRRADVAKTVASREAAEDSAPDTRSDGHLSETLTSLAALLPDWLDAVELDPVIEAQFHAASTAYDEKIRRSRSPSARFVLQQRKAQETLALSERHRDLVEIYAARTSAMEPLVDRCFRTLEAHGDIWPLLAEFDAAVQTAAEIIRKDRAHQIPVGRLHIYEYAKKHAHQSQAMAQLADIWRVVKRLTSSTNTVVADWDAVLVPYRQQTEPPDTQAPVL